MCKDYIILDSLIKKECHANDNSYHYTFDKITGYFKRWGKSYNDNPLYSPFGPEILDLEISSGYCPISCPFCYKNNNNQKQLHNMSLTTFKKILHKMPNTLTQIAFGITTLSANPDFFNMMNYSKQLGFIPNFTMTGIDLTTHYANLIAATAGAVAVSVHQNKDVAYNAIQQLTSLNMKQINIHMILAKETLNLTYEILNDIQSDKRLQKLNAIVFLSLKPKNITNNNFHQLNINEFQNIIHYCQSKNIKYGSDSCSTHKLNLHNSMYVEPCESGLFSAYINSQGDFFPCSFSENITNPINVLNYNDFIQVWNHETTINWRNNLLKKNRNCPIYNI